MENLKKEIEQLKKERNAVLLAHYYVDDEVQEIADYVGDSYYLAKVALKEAISVINKAGSKGVYHKNTCARKISRLTKAVNEIA